MQLLPEFNGPISASHGLCYLCRLPRREGEVGVLATGTHIDMEGDLEICQACVEEMASHFGCLTAEKSRTVLKSNRELGRKAQAAQRAIERNDEIGRLIAELQATQEASA